MPLFPCLAGLFAVWLAPGPAAAEVPIGGYVIAREACPALLSIRAGSNPGGIEIVPGTAYRVVAKNRPAASHYLVEVEGADPARRWVAVSCGELVAAVDGSSLPTPIAGTGAEAPEPRRDADAAADRPRRDAPRPEQGGRRPAYVLAVSWQPAFCEAQPDRAECESQTDDRFDASHFTLHGLWPQPRTLEYCRASEDDEAAARERRWSDLPELDLEAETAAALDQVMPGRQSFLDRYEWTKHGSCDRGATPQTYFRRSIALLDALNASPVQALFSDAVGDDVTEADIRDAFDAAFGRGAGDRVDVECDPDGDRLLISELRISLVGTIDDAPDLGRLIAAARPVRSGCDGGVVDPVGDQ